MREALDKVRVEAPSVPLIANVSAGPIRDPAVIRRSLVEQVTGTVRWRESVAYMAGEGVTRLVEVGAGKVLSGLVKRIAAGVDTVSVGTPEDVAAFVATMKS
jgi:[acyl-carrier-protein] S-malonyltransferase